MWQKCPICEGRGYVETQYMFRYKLDGTERTTSSNTIETSTCPTCNGMRIIDEKTGAPANRDQLLIDQIVTKTKDFGK